MVLARDLMGEDYHVVAVIGDGALTGGMALAALNKIGELQKRMLIVLNDNEMSISENVGALNKYFKELQIRKWVQDAEKLGKNILERISPSFSASWTGPRRRRSSFCTRKTLSTPGGSATWARWTATTSRGSSTSWSTSRPWTAPPSSTWSRRRARGTRWPRPTPSTGTAPGL